MNCDQTNRLLTAYLHHEVPLSEGQAIQAHLAGCADCRQILADLENLEDRLGQYLQLKADSLNPPKLAWETMQARLGQERSPTKRLVPAGNGKGFFSMSWADRSPLRRLAVALVILLLLTLLAPPALVLAGRVREWLNSSYSFKIQDLEASIGGFDAFIPYYPTYIPKGFANGLGMGGNTGPDWDQLELTFSRRERFVTLLQSVGLKDGALPEGQAVNIQGRDGVYVPDFANSIDELRQEFPGISITTNFDYSGLGLMVWYMGEIRMELISNLPFEEGLKIAQSLALMENAQEQVLPGSP